MQDCIVEEVSDASVSQNESLTAEESARLTQLEEIIESHGKTLGEALREIHDNRLYRAEYRTWEEYCKERWNRTRIWGYRLIAFEREKERCYQNGNTPPTSEGSFRAGKKKGGKRSKANKPSEPSKVIVSLDEEFESFKATVARWKNALSHADYLDLVNRAHRYSGNILLEEDEQPANAEAGEVEAV